MASRILTAIGVLSFLSITALECWADPITPPERLTITSGELFYLIDTDDPFIRGTVSGNGFTLILGEIPQPVGLPTDSQTRTVFSGTVFGTLELEDSTLLLGNEITSSIVLTITTHVDPFDPGPLPFPECCFGKTYPFQLSGTLFGDTAEGRSLRFDLFGQGNGTTAFITLGETASKPGALTLNFASPTPVPEPGSFFLVAAGGAGLLNRMRRRKRIGR